MRKSIIVLLSILTLIIMVGCSNNAPAQEQPATDNQVVQEDSNQKDTANSGNDTENADRISQDEAKSIVLNHAGLNENDVEFTKFEEGLDDGIQQYEIEFISGDKKYEYNVRMDDGTILEYDSESASDND